MTRASDAARLALRHARYTSYWLDSLAADEPEPALEQDTRCDLLIVGGGFCGLWAAILAREQSPDRDILLIEAKTIGNGASARPAAIVSTSVMHGIDNTERQFPGEVAELERLGRENLDGFRNTLQRYSIDCEAEWGGEMLVAIGDEGLPAIEQEHALYARYGHDVVKLNQQDLQAEIRSPLFHGALWSRQRSGTLHPGKLVRELKRVALELGVRIHEHTPHLGNRSQNTGIRVRTPRGGILARKVFLATNAWAAGHRHIRRRVVAVRDRIVVTEPLSTAQLSQIGWRHRQGVYDTRTQLNYMRLTSDNRILFGGRLAYAFGNDTDPAVDHSEKPYVRLVQALFRTFPTLESKIDISYAWSGPIGLTARMAVHYQRFHDGDMIFAGGYSGFGVSATRFGARVGLALLDGDDIPETRLEFAQTVPGYVPPEPFRWLGARLTLYALDTLDERGGWRVPWIRLVQRLGFPVTL